MSTKHFCQYIKDRNKKRTSGDTNNTKISKEREHKLNNIVFNNHLHFKMSNGSVIPSKYILLVEKQLLAHPHCSADSLHILSGRAFDDKVSDAAQEKLINHKDVTKDMLISIALGHNIRSSEETAMRALEALFVRPDVDKRDVDRVGCTYDSQHRRVMWKAWELSKKLPSPR